MRIAQRSLASSIAIVTAVAVCGLLFSSCSSGEFSQTTPGSPRKNPTKSGTEGAGSVQDAKSKRSGNAEGFAQAGKSLDLYVIMDKSGSLYVDPTTRSMPNSGSDPQCKRFDAFLALTEALKGKMKQGEQVRVSIVVFNDGVEALETTENILSLDRAAIETRYKSGVCDIQDLKGTQYAVGINKALEEFLRLSSSKKLPLESVLFFSDGAARDDENPLRQAIAQLNSTFPQRVYGVLLGQTSDKCQLRSSTGTQLSTTECMLEVTGKSTERLLQVDKADGLVNALTGLVNK